MWTYQQSTGNIWDNNGEHVARGYSGAGASKNDPEAQDQQGVGPLPRGLWSIGQPYDSERVGPLALPLTPTADTETFGRSAFLIHGDSIAAPGTASRGCIILPRDVRQRIAASADRLLFVIR